MNIQVKKLDPRAKLPQYAHPGDAGMDIFSLEEYTLEPGENHSFKTGISMAFPEGYVALVKDKSSLASQGIHTLAGVIDAGYRGEYLIQLINLGTAPFHFEAGRKIAQILMVPVTIASLEEADELDETARGEGGFGSTGKF